MEPVFPELANWWVTVIVGVVFIVGVFGTVFPGVPGLSIIALATIAYALTHGLSGGGLVLFCLILGIAAVGGISNLVLPSKRAFSAGANTPSLAVAVVMAIVGLFVIPIIGLPLGGAVGLFLGEIMQGRSSEAAWDSTKETLMGFGLSLALQFFIAWTCLLLWVFWVVFL